MAEPLIDFSESRIQVMGQFFEGSAAVKLKDNMARHVGDLGEMGLDAVRAGLARTRRGTGFTADHVELYQRPANSLYATIRLQAQLARPPGSALYPASRRPYIVNAVLESGLYLGKQRQTPLRAWSRAAAKLRARAKYIRENLLLRGL